MKKGSKPGDLGEANRMLILNCLRLKGSMSKADLARELGMSFPAVSANVKILIEQGRVRESGEGDNSLGRKSTLLSFNEEMGVVVGVDIGRFWIRAMAADLMGKVLSYVKVPAVPKDDGNELHNIVADVIRQALKESQKPEEDILCIGIGLPGVIRDDTILLAPYFPDINLKEFRNYIEEEFDTELILENSVNMGAIGELSQGAGKGCDNFIVINYGVGVGSALVLNGKIYSGSHNAAGEIGYMVAEPMKLRDSFEEVGVLESIISKEKIEKFISHDNFQKEVELLVEKYRANDLYVRSVLDEISINIGITLINLCAALDLETVIISGGLGTAFGSVFMETWRSMLVKHIPFPPKIVLSELGNKECVLGAIHRSIEHLFVAKDII